MAVPNSYLVRRNTSLIILLDGKHTLSTESLQGELKNSEEINEGKKLLSFILLFRIFIFRLNSDYGCHTGKDLNVNVITSVLVSFENKKPTCSLRRKLNY